MELYFQSVDKQSFTNPDGLKVRADQVGYVCADIRDFVKQWENDPEFDCYVVREAGHAVGFFAIDRNLDRHPYLAGQPNGCVLRCFMIDERYQGRGIADQTLLDLDEMLAEKYPAIRRCFLTVNFGNAIALAAYKKTGFEVFSEPYLGGSSGPQHVMQRPVS